MKAPALERCLRHVQVTDTCWLWTGSKDRDGYGRFAPTSPGPGGLAHRYLYGALVGCLPNGLELDHLCRTPSCVNPSHLEPVSHRTNMLRSATPPAINAIKTHCVNGHALSGDNLIVGQEGYRRCRICWRATCRKSARKYKAKLNEARGK
jgi:hypothetical protein